MIIIILKLPVNCHNIDPFYNTTQPTQPFQEELLKKYGIEEEQCRDHMAGKVGWWKSTKPKVWAMFDEPYSSLSAKVFSYIYIFIYIYTYTAIFH